MQNQDPVLVLNPSLIRLAVTIGKNMEYNRQILMPPWEEDLDGWLEDDAIADLQDQITQYNDHAIFVDEFMTHFYIAGKPAMPHIRIIGYWWWLDEGQPRCDDQTILDVPYEFYEALPSLSEVGVVSDDLRKAMVEDGSFDRFV